MTVVLYFNLPVIIYTHPSWVTILITSKVMDKNRTNIILFCFRHFSGCPFHERELRSWMMFMVTVPSCNRMQTTSACHLLYKHMRAKASFSPFNKSLADGLRLWMFSEISSYKRNILQIVGSYLPPNRIRKNGMTWIKWPLMPLNSRTSSPVKSSHQLKNECT